MKPTNCHGLHIDKPADGMNDVISNEEDWCVAATACTYDNNGKRTYYLANAILGHDTLVEVLSNLAKQVLLEAGFRSLSKELLEARYQAQAVLNTIHDYSKPFVPPTNSSAEPAADTDVYISPNQRPGNPQ